MRFFIPFIAMGAISSIVAEEPDEDIKMMAGLLRPPKPTVSVADLRERFEKREDLPVSIEISLSTSMLKVFVDEKQVLSCQVTCGRKKHATPVGEFLVTGRQEEFGNINYGSYVNKEGFTIMRGVYTHLDPMPSGVHFVASKTFFGLETDGELLLHSGFITPFSSSSGSVIIPLNAAQLLFQLIPNQTKITVVE